MTVTQKVIRHEVENLLRPGRLHRLLSVNAEVFQLMDSQWVELTFEPVLVHLIHDRLEGMTKILAIHHLKLIIYNLPVTPNSDIYTPSKKFVHFVCDKFERSSPHFGFGFKEAADCELFNHHLLRIRCAGIAPITVGPPLVTVTSSTPTRPHCRALFNMNGFTTGGSGIVGPVFTDSSSSSTLQPPFGFISSPLKNMVPRSGPGSFATNTAGYGMECGALFGGSRTDFGEQDYLSSEHSRSNHASRQSMFGFRATGEFASAHSEQRRELNSSPSRTNGSPQRLQLYGGSADVLGKQAMDIPFVSPGKSPYELGNLPRGASTPLVSPQSTPYIANVDPTELPVSPLSENPADLHAFTERRLRDFLSSLQLSPIASGSDTGTSISTGSCNAHPSFNPAGAIGTPIKCQRDGVSSGSPGNGSRDDEHTSSNGD